MNINELIRNELVNALQKANFPVDVSFVVEIPKDTTKGDYASNIAMKLTKALRRNPLDIAKEIVSCFNLEAAKVSRVEIAAPGFLNFFVSMDSFDSLISKINDHADQFGSCNYGQGKKYNIEFVSANQPEDYILAHPR